jgi:hypothetical protein
MEYLFLFVLPVFGAAAGAYFGAYWKKKGENAAIHADINKLVDQISAVTTAAKQIEGKIADDYWSRQKRWELHREVVFEAIDHIANIQSRTTRQTALAIAAQGITDSAKRQLIDREIEGVAREAVEGMPKLMSISYRISLVAGQEVQSMIHHVHQLLLNAQPYVRDRNFNAAIQAGSEVENATREVLAAIRREMGFPDLLFAPQSSESSAGQSPAPPFPE